MKTRPILLLIFSVPLIANICSEKYEEDSTIVFINNSSDTVLYYEEFNLPMDTLLPDYTWFPTDKNLEINRILPNTRKEFPGRHIALFEKLEGEVNMWFIFKYDTVHETPWDTIVSKYMVERRYDLTLSILDSLDWTITYP